jgi:hypothetical protein
MAQTQELWSCCATYGYREHTYGIVHDAEEVVNADSGNPLDSLEPPQSACNSDDMLSVVSRYSSVPC